MTSSISWILSVEPVLSRRRHLAQEMTFMERTEQWNGTVTADAKYEVFQGTLLTLAEQVITVGGDSRQIPIPYYFHSSDRDSSLAVFLPEITSLAPSASRHGSATIRFQADPLL
ncbi:MAG: hypothetical protein M3354_10715 [Chloroflexota bacterium]|nr:hypothetical protein [Chloroflexota bacterium]